MRRVILLFLVLCLCLSAAQAEEFDMAQGFTIGVAVYNPDDAETRAFRAYYENYLGEAFNANFIYSNAIASWEDERAFIEQMHEMGVQGIIAFLSTDSRAAVELCDQYGIYYVFGSTGISDAEFDAIKGNPHFLGCISASEANERQAGADMAEFFAKDDAEKSHCYLICTGGAGMGNVMHRVRAMAMLEKLAEIYGLTYDTSIEDLILASEPTEAANDAGVKIVLVPGYPYAGDLEADVAEQLASGGIDTVMSTLVANTLIEPIRAAEEEGGVDIRVGSIDCFTNETYEFFNGVYTGGKPEMDYLAGKYGACVAPSFVAVCNACSGYAEDFRPNGEAFRLTQEFWTATNVDEFNELYALSVGTYENAYSAADIMGVLKAYTPDASWADFESFAQR